MLRLLLVDDHPVVRAGLKALLAAEIDFSVVSEAADGRVGVDLAQSLRPDVVVMDVSLPAMGGEEATRLITRDRPDIAVVALSLHEDVAFVRQLLEAGALGYVLKRSASEELVRAIRSVAAGNRYLDPALSGSMLVAALGSAKAVPGVSLSKREGEVMRLLAQGLTMKEVAEKLAVSPRTLETYRARGMEKIGLKSRADLVRYAIRCGWLAG